MSPAWVYSISVLSSCLPFRPFQQQFCSYLQPSSRYWQVLICSCPSGAPLRHSVTRDLGLYLPGPSSLCSPSPSTPNLSRAPEICAAAGSWARHSSSVFWTCHDGLSYAVAQIHWVHFHLSIWYFSPFMVTYCQRGAVSFSTTLWKGSQPRPKLVCSPPAAFFQKWAVGGASDTTPSH